MYRTVKIPSVLCLVALILTLRANTIQAQTGQPVFRSPADAGRTNRYRPNLMYVNETGAIVAADRKGAEADAGDDPLDP